MYVNMQRESRIFSKLFWFCFAGDRFDLPLIAGCCGKISVIPKAWENAAACLTAVSQCLALEGGKRNALLPVPACSKRLPRHPHCSSVTGNSPCVSHIGLNTGIHPMHKQSSVVPAFLRFFALGKLTAVVG